MRRIPSKGTKPEMFLRLFLHSQGYRYRLHAPDLPVGPIWSFEAEESDLRSRLFLASTQSVPGGQNSGIQARLLEPKLLRNVERDRNHLADLRKLGWKFLVIWECEINDSERAERELFDSSAGDLLARIGGEHY